MDVDTSVQRDVWLVKVPKYMATAWKSAGSRAELGKLQLPKNNEGKVKFITDPKLQQQPNQDGKLPSTHILTLQPLVHQRMVILAQNKSDTTSATTTTTTTSNNERISFEGDVRHRGELRPIGDMSYMSLKATTIKQAAKPTRVTQILDKAVTAYKPRGAAQLAHEADLRKKKEEAKKLVREDKEIVQGRLFVAFEKERYYNIKDLWHAQEYVGAEARVQALQIRARHLKREVMGDHLELGFLKKSLFKLLDKGHLYAHHHKYVRDEKH